MHKHAALAPRLQKAMKYFRLTPLARALLTTIACAASPSLHAAMTNSERLSARLLADHGPFADTTALHWQPNAQKSIQAQWRTALLGQLDGNIALRDWISSLPVTGRSPLAQNDAHWLMANPAQDPVLGPNDLIQLYPRPRYVGLVNDDAQICLVPHQSGAYAHDYVQACGWQTDWAWIAQPDAAITRVGTELWNAHSQNQPAPGAWVWAPQRNADFDEQTSELLISFLATQAPAEVRYPHAPTFELPARNQRRAPPKGVHLTASDWGEIGLLQTPTARMAQAGEFRVHFSKVLPYNRGTLLFQPFDWLETAVRYTDVSNRLYGPNIAGDQTYKDKSLDVKFRLRDESSLAPALALGVRDVGGTGLFSGEYLVANKRFGNWDASLGLGWGYLGKRGNINNPLGWIDPSMSQRANTVVSTGTVNTGGMFTGPTALFGGVQWSRADSPWVFKAELDGNNYQQEPQNNHQRVDSPINFGVVYRVSPVFDLTAGWERGNTWMLGFTVHNNLAGQYMPKLLDRWSAAEEKPNLSPKTQLISSLEERTGWRVVELDTHPATTTTHLVLEIDDAHYTQARVDRATALLHAQLAPAVQHIYLHLQRRGLPTLMVRIDRQEYAHQQQVAEPDALRLPYQTVLNPAHFEHPEKHPQQTSSTQTRWSPSYSQILGGPNNFLLYQAGLQGNVEHRFAEGTWISSTVNARFADNYGGFVYDGPSKLPRVRTDQRRYVITSAVTLPTAYASHVFNPAANHYAGIYGGILEPMYGGVGAEWLYAPFQSTWAVGADWNLVRQRGFAQDLQFRDYSTSTGHASVYWDTGWNDVLAKLSFGRYLAGDWGGTIDLSRQFSNGVSAGFWATKTNISAETFGEGSFDKGVYITIPFDAMLPKSTSGQAGIVWSPLTRDGGARLVRPWTLRDLTQTRFSRALTWTPSVPRVQRSGDSVLASTTLSLRPRTVASNPWNTVRSVAYQWSDQPATNWLWGLGTVLVSAATLDTAGQRWAQGEHSSAVNQIAKASNYMPWAMAAVAGSLATGLGGEEPARTGITALTAAAYTFGTNTLLRASLGRARPFENQGANHFQGPGPGASQSGMPSNHVGLAFALATPFAQQYDMPWLYAAAASTALGRVHSEEHWVSDTVAGALLGYAFGSMVQQERSALERGWSLGSNGPGQVVARWRY